MNFKEIGRKILGIRTDEELAAQAKKTPKEKVIEFFKSLGFALIAALFIITFFIQNTRIPTGSMENTILVGDFVIVNKFIYGSSSPRYIPFTEIALPYFTIPGIREPEAGDIVVFEFPGDREDLVPKELNVNYVKRLIGMPGDTLQIINRVAYINGKEFPVPPYVHYALPYSKPADRGEDYIYPAGAPWNEDNYGPYVVPKAGMKIILTPENYMQWRTFIDREHGERVVELKGGTVTIKGKPVNSYTVQKDYYFMIGDNRNDSYDSRFWGPVSRDAVVGSAFLVLFSWDREIPFFNIFKLLGSVRLERIMMVLE
ncbi:MAG: signal peptidase I [Ignavibacteriaceae bacterium]|nr:signal peptidase I [Ignavibacteriaceae bacterium]